MSKADLEYNAYPNEFAPNGVSEFFPMAKNAPQKSKGTAQKKKQTMMAKMLATTAALGVGVVAVVASAPPKPLPKLPVANSVQVLSYTPSVFVSAPTAEDSTAGYYTQSSYQIAFPFTLYEGEPTRVEITGKATTNPHFSFTDDAQETPISVTLPKEELTVTEGGIYASYTVEDITLDYLLTATLFYEHGGEEKTLQTQPYLAGQSYFIMQETNFSNQIQVTEEGENLRCDVTFTDLRAGAFELRAEQLSVYYADAITGEELGSFEEQENLPVYENGGFTYTFTIAKPTVEGVCIELTLDGDSYFEGKPMGLQSSTHVAVEIPLGETYSVEGVTVDLQSENMKWNGLQATMVEMNDFYANGYTPSLNAVLPQKSVCIRVTLTGLATAQGRLSLDVVVNEQKISDLETYPAYVYEGDTECYIDLYFTMPAENVGVEDITINGIIGE